MKPTRRKWIAGLLTLSMLCTLVPGTMFAAKPEPTPAPAAPDVVYGAFDESDAWHQGSAGPITKNLPYGVKSINKTATPVAGEENVFDITLQVVTEQSTTIAPPDSAATVLVIDTSGSMAWDSKGNDGGWFGISKKDQRITHAKNEAKKFVETFGGENAATGTGRYLAIVDFDNDADIELNWTDVSTEAGKVKAKHEIDELDAGGGTNLDAGLEVANALLKQDEADNIEKELKNVVVLTDGAPTYATNKYGRITGNGSNGSSEINELTAASATALKKSASVYTVCYGAVREKTYRGGPTVGNFLKDSIASPATAGKDYAYNANNTEELQKAFKAITKEIVDGLDGKSLVVCDTKPANVAYSDGATDTFDWKLSETEPAVEKNGDITTYTYTKTYRATLTPQASKDPVTYPLNGPTYLQQGEKQYPFPIPAVKKAPTIKDISYTVEYYKDGILVDGDRQTVTKENVAIDVNELTVENKDTIAANNKYEGFALDVTEPAPIPDTIADKGIIKIYYATDKMGPNGPEEPDGEPDKYQAGIVYESADETQGSVAPTWELVDLKDAEGQRATQQEAVEVKGSEATANTNYRFNSWNLDKSTAITYRNNHDLGSAQLEPTMALLGGQIYTFTADFRDASINLSVIKNADASKPYKVDDTVEYTVTVTNEGTDTIRNITVTEGLEGAVFENETNSITIESLAGDTSQTFTVTYTVVAEAVDENSQIINTVEVAAGEGNNPPPATKSIDITKDLTYNVNYYKDGEQDLEATVTSTVEVPYKQNTVTVNQTDIAPLDKYPGFILDRVDPIPNAVSNGDTINVYYVSDNWHDADMTDPTDDVDRETGGDGIADKQQVNIKFVSADKTQGTVTGDNILQIITPEPDSVSPEKDGVVVTPAEDYAFDYWTKTINGDDITTPMYDIDAPFSDLVEVGSEVVYTAHFATDVIGPRIGPDDVPDKYQALVKYVSADPAQGTVTNNYEFFDFGKGETSQPDTTLDGSKAVALEQYNFVNWTKDFDNEIKFANETSMNTATIQPIMDLNGGKIYTFTANFEKQATPTPPPTPGPTPPTPGVIDPGDPEDLNTVDHYSYIVGYEDGTVRPNAQVTRAEVATIFFRLLTDEARNEGWSQTNKFSDVPANTWYSNAISTLTNMGILSGYEDGTFRPNAPITRAEYATIAVSFYDVAVKDYQGTFSDVPQGKWYTQYVETAAAIGLIQGMGDGTFAPESNITRAQACVLTNNTLNRHPDEAHMLPAADMITWPDNKPGTWYYAAIQEATNSHDYEWDGDLEQWTVKLEQRDWAELEKEWSEANSAAGGGEVKDEANK